MTDERMTDGLLRRQEVLRAMYDTLRRCISLHDQGIWYQMLRDMIRNLKAEPVRMKGRWEIYTIPPFDGEDCRCPLCGQHNCLPSWKFCPGCGAEMEWP